MRRTPRELETTNRTLSRRALLLGGAQLVFAGGLAMRMRHLQVDQADQFRLLAEENRINIRLLAPARGEIFDRNGIALARNFPSYRIIIDLTLPYCMSSTTPCLRSFIMRKTASAM